MVVAFQNCLECNLMISQWHDLAGFKLTVNHLHIQRDYHCVRWPEAALYLYVNVIFVSYDFELCW